MAPKKKEEEPPPPEEEEEQEPPPPDPDEDTEIDTGLKLPLRPKDVLTLWAFKDDYAQQGKALSDMLGLEAAYATPDQRDIACDFHIFNLAHAKAICLTHRQAAVFIAIMGSILAMLKSPDANPKTKPSELCTSAQAIKEFQRLILAHSAENPPESLLVFKVSEAKMLTDFASSTLFKHFLLYQYCANFDREVQTLRFSMGLRRPLPPPDLRTARHVDKARKRRSKEPPNREGADDAEEDAPEEEELTEEQEIERLVQAKLKETEGVLEGKLQDRDKRLTAEYEQKKEEKAAQEPPKKGKK